MRIRNYSKTDTDLAKYSALEHLLLGDLCEILEDPLDEESHLWLIAVLEFLADVVHIDYELKWEDSYLVEVLEEYPWWDDDVQKLRRNHHTLCQQIQSLYQMLLLETDSRQRCVFHQDLRRWIEDFTLYRRREREFVQLATNLVIGGEG